MDILLVEDEISLAMIVKDALEEEGYEVAVARDGLDGIEHYFKEHPALIIADVMMPEVDGFEMVHRIRRMDKEVPVLFLSARSSVDDIVQGFELGANDYLRKPFSLRELIVRVKALIVKSKAEPAAVAYHEIGLYTFYPSTQTLEAGVNQSSFPSKSRSCSGYFARAGIFRSIPRIFYWNCGEMTVFTIPAACMSSSPNSGINWKKTPVSNY